MISVIDICNLALTHIAKLPIASLDDESEQARKCKLVYPIARDSVLRAHDWGFATSIEQLAIIADIEIPGWDYVYSRPGNCLYIRKIYDEGNVNSQVTGQFKEFKTEDEDVAIASNTEDAYCEFTEVTTDPNDFDSNFVEALSYKLAAMMAKALTGDITLADKMELRFNASIAEARRINSSERNITRTEYISYVEAR